MLIQNLGSNVSSLVELLKVRSEKQDDGLVRKLLLDRLNSPDPLLCYWVLNILQ